MMSGNHWASAILVSLVIHAVILGLFFFPAGSSATKEEPLKPSATPVETNETPAPAAGTTESPAPATNAAPAPVNPTVPVATSPDTPAAIPEFYVVKAGDTLTKIAKIYGTTPEAIAAANEKPLKKMNLIWVGQKIKLR